MRKIAAALIVVATVVVGLLFILPALVSTDWARSELGWQLSHASGMDIRLEGPVGVSFLPSLAVVAKDIGISTDKGDISIEVPRFSTAVTLSSLWSDKLEIQSITLVDPAIRIKSPAADTNAKPTPSAPSKRTVTSGFICLSAAIPESDAHEKRPSRPLVQGRAEFGRHIPADYRSLEER